ncbi:MULTISPECIES: DUF4097 family beta strand repeat-containing protein [Treponema]|uniref:DUF4097 domain-containing protein n=1 Tax=Treponema denticola (strain ATCC 35405 / DSM 14222 / CIP 103919 / JCM 8153 / KCTC 15104) TaxID=243275 RepID=Q73LK3_TREDE|nr:MULTISPECIES: DUF4097 family beta strand repeat-containing protein [Treponema]AAS12374.1 hypothetical protein TDE_1859 [Treponema denticola ATCC 35405]EMB38154.1 hypothetical protein HMPREF9735_01260 [Treponema denticola ATCC 33521]EMB39705.1 hypothetical protein HMPREF9721_00574 [Treponema denticola ATCC 35404]HCY95947.1 DUF1700 domain-containing protein [Treponema sp.]
MTKDQFLTELNSYLSVLKPEDRKNTIEFYEEYFEDAESEEAAIEELGAPKKLAEEIIDFHKTSYKGENTQVSRQFSPDESISEIILNITAAKVLINASQEEKIEYTTQNIADDDFSAKIENGKLIIKEKPVFFFSKKGFASFLENFNINTSFNAGKREIIINIPKDTRLEKLEFNSQMGSLKIEEVNVEVTEGYTTCGNFSVKSGLHKKIDFNTSAGSINISDIDIETMKLSSSAGAIKFENIKAGNISASTGAGTIDFIRTESSYINANSGAGNITGNELKSDRGKFNTGAGTNKFQKCDFNEVILNTGAGSIIFQGNLHDYAKINSAIGSVDLNLPDNVENYDINIFSKQGRVKLNGENVEGKGDRLNLGSKTSDTNIKISTAFGKIKISTREGE